MTDTVVTVDNFVRAETDAMFAGLLKVTGGVNAFSHDRKLASLDQQPVIRQNRDTLYSFAIVDISDGASVTIPEYGDRYLSVMLINRDHYINRVLHEPGTYSLTPGELGSDFIALVVRILFNPNDRDDLAMIHDIQDGITLTAGAERPFSPGAFDANSHKKTRDLLLALSEDLTDFSHSFGRKDGVDPIHHLLATASGWGGLPDYEAKYFSLFPSLPPGQYKITLKDVPADAFYSVSVYNGEGYFEPGPAGTTNVNSVFGTTDADGSMTVWFGEFDDGRPNTIATPPGWNIILRLYRPRLNELATWQVPDVQAAT